MTNELTPDGLYRLSVRSDGKVDAANRVSDGATVWCPNSDRYTSENPDTAAFIDGNYNLSDRPASPSPSPASSPNYLKFRTDMMASSAYLRISSANLQTLSLNTNLVALLWRFGDDPSLGAEIVGVWNKMATLALPTPTEIAALNAIATASNVPIRLAALTGQMSII